MSGSFFKLVWLTTLLTFFVGCGMMGPDDKPPRSSGRPTAGPRETSIRGASVVPGSGTLVINKGRQDVGKDNGGGEPSTGQREIIPSPTPPLGDDSQSDGFLAGDLSRGVHAVAGEVAESLELKKTLVVWLIDKTPGSVGIRTGAMQSITSVDGQATDKAQSHGGAGHPLSIAIVGYGKTVTMLTPEPTENVAQAANLVSGIGEEATDAPLTFTAVNKAADQYLPYRNKGYEVIFVIMANQNGHDWDQLNDVIPKLRRMAVPVYGIGAAIPFGREAGVPADKVPCESCELERIDLGYPGRQSETDLTDSGFGPFGLERLCRNTHGQFFRIRANNMSPGWTTGEDGTVSSDVRDALAPDYVSQRDYQRLLSENKARMALVEAAKVAHADVLESVRQTTFVPQTDAARTAKMVTNAQRGAAEKSLDVDRIYNVLKPGEADRPKLKGARWQAEFDLAMGRRSGRQDPNRRLQHDSGHDQARQSLYEAHEPRLGARSGRRC